LQTQVRNKENTEKEKGSQVEAEAKEARKGKCMQFQRMKETKKRTKKQKNKSPSQGIFLQNNKKK
jgi:hypothetical protein